MVSTSPAQFYQMVSDTIYVFNNLGGGWFRNGVYFLLGIILSVVVLMYVLPVIFHHK